jgi:hypothetical protein
MIEGMNIESAKKPPEALNREPKTEFATINTNNKIKQMKI